MESDFILNRILLCRNLKWKTVIKAVNKLEGTKGERRHTQKTRLKIITNERFVSLPLYQRYKKYAFVVDAS